MKTHKLSTNKEVKLKEMSVDDMDYCNDLPQMRYENDQIVAITNLAKARTAWIKSLTDEEKNELSLAIQEYQRLGE